MEKVFNALDGLINYAVNNLELAAKNVDYVHNGLLRILNIDTCPPSDAVYCTETRPEKPLTHF
nr:hypothetical protein [Clostridia bacterium]